MTKSTKEPQVLRRDVPAMGGPSHQPVTFPRSPAVPSRAPTDGANSENDSQGPWANWPSGIKSTCIRRKWFEKLQPLPEGLDLADISARLNEPYHAVYRWAQFFRYPFPDRRSAKPSHCPTFDWRIPNRDLAAIWGVSSHSIAVNRRRLGVGPAKWNLRGGATIRSRAYKKLLEEEKLNARRAAVAADAG